MTIINIPINPIKTADHLLIPTFSDKNNITRPNYWSGWNLKPLEIEFWLQVDDRLHERLKYKKKNEIWNKFLLNP